MADFFIRVLKWLAALVVAYFVLFVVIFLVIAGIGLALEPAPRVVQEKSILVLDLGFNLTDQPRDDDAAEILRSALEGEIIETASLRQVLDGLKKARGDSRIAGLLITGNLLSSGSGGSFAAIRELRRGIRSFAADKPAWAYLDGDTLRDLYLKSAATEVISNPYASVDFRGLRAERLYLGDAFERIGVEVQVEAFEEYKSAADTFRRGSMSEAEREELSVLLQDLWAVIVGDIAAARGLKVVELDTVAGEDLILYGEEIPEAGLADRLSSEDELIDFLSEKSAYDTEAKTFRQFDFLDYLDLNGVTLPRLDLLGDRNKVALLYAEGVLVDGRGDDMSVGSDDLIRYLREVRKNDSVKAVVLRINSPGGSAIAANKVVREIELTNAEKPVVASMGGIAASAGYMLAAPCEAIYAEPSTITGSIGVVIMLPNVEKLAANLSVNVDGVETHPFAGAFSIARPKSDEEMAQIRALAADFYDQFIELVAKNRDLSRDEVRARARGRVWSGLSAIDNGLVDTSGGMLAALRHAADLAGIGDDYRLIERPRRRTLEQQIEDLFLDTGAAPAGLSRPGPLKTFWNDARDEWHRLKLLNDPHGRYAILPYTLKIH